VSAYSYRLTTFGLRRKRGGRYLPSRFDWVDLLIGEEVYRWAMAPRRAVRLVWVGPLRRRHTVTWPEMQREMSVKRRKASEATTANHSAAMETEMFGEHLPLLEHCCMTRYEDGTVRRVGWLSIQTVGSEWVVTAKDPDGAVSLTVRAATLDAALDDMAVWLSSDEAPWTPDPWLAARKPRSKK